MNRPARLAIGSRLRLAALPVVHLFLIVLTMILSYKNPADAYYRIFGVDPLAAAVGMVSEGSAFYGALLIFGTAWWYFIGWIGWVSRNGRINRLSAGLGAILALFFGIIGAKMSTDIFRQDLDDGVLSAGAILQYASLGVLCLGAFVVAAYSAMAALRRKKPEASRSN